MLEPSYEAYTVEFREEDDPTADTADTADTEGDTADTLRRYDGAERTELGADTAVLCGRLGGD